MADLLHKKRKLTSFQIIILGFAGVILVGALLLMLPISTKSGVVTPFKIAENIINEEQAIELAKKQTTANYDDVSARFDTEKGIWTVTLSFKKASNGDGVHSYRITHEGKVLDAAYGD